MHLALLVTNTDGSAFAARHPHDGEKFAQMIAQVRPDWRVTAFDLPKGPFPPDNAGFDGWMIGGSPASVHDNAPWIAGLMRLIQQLMSQRSPIFAARFGHQAMAKTLGEQFACVRLDHLGQKRLALSNGHGFMEPQVQLATTIGIGIALLRGMPFTGGNHGFKDNSPRRGQTPRRKAAGLPFQTGVNLQYREKLFQRWAEYDRLLARQAAQQSHRLKLQKSFAHGGAGDGELGHQGRFVDHVAGFQMATVNS